MVSFLRRGRLCSVGGFLRSALPLNDRQEILRPSNFESQDGRRVDFDEKCEDDLDENGHFNFQMRIDSSQKDSLEIKGRCLVVDKLSVPSGRFARF
jgi:hypothetical protein